MVDVELPIVVADLDGGVVESLRDRGWRLARTGGGSARVVVMPHVTRAVLRAFVTDLDEVR